MTTYYVRSSVLGNQVVAEVGGGVWSRGYVYLGSQLLAIQQGGVRWVHQDPVTKGQRVTDASGGVTSSIELDPWGGETVGRWNLNTAQPPRKYTTYERDLNSSDEAMHRRYNRWWARFDQPDPWDGSYDLREPQSFNRYAYVRNDPVNFVDPTGLYEACVHEAMTKFLATLSGNYSDQVAATLGRFAGGGSGGADSFRYAATNPINFIRGIFRRGPSADIHFASEARLQREIGRFDGYIAQGTRQGYQRAAFVLHSIQDVHGAHQGYSLPLGHARDGTKPDRIIGDARFMRAANESFQLLSGNRNGTLSAGQINDLINAIVTGCGRMADNLQITRPAPTGGGGGGGGGDFGGGRGGGGYPSWWYSMWAFADWVRSIRVEVVTVRVIED
ncbi:MAG: RHS repeat-associated core domain-containing protein [Pseudonocardiaceae bacterium]